MQRTSIERMYGAEFFMRVSTLKMPWKGGRTYVCVELDLKYLNSPSIPVLKEGHGDFWCAIEDTYDRAYVKACKYVKDSLEEKG